MIDRFEQYGRIVRWARNRYYRGGKLMLTLGGRPYRYALIEDIAAARYLNVRRRWPNLTLADAYKHPTK